MANPAQMGGPRPPILPGKEVGLGSNSGGGPYLPTSSPQPSQYGAQSVRATGGGAGDAAWRQNLATFSGGQFERPGGSLSFNPLSTNPFSGAPTGGGNSPVQGSPSTLLQYALGMNPLTMMPSSPTATPSAGPAQTSTPSGQSTQNSIPEWLDQFMSMGGMNNLAPSQ
jgi:hypothetical protein